jgi:urease accessory protein
MPTTELLLRQRSVGRVTLRMEGGCVAVMQESGSAKCRLPRGSREAIVINTSGGLAGGDTLSIACAIGDGAHLAVTTQAAERVYRTLGPPARVDIALSAGAGARLLWLPQETLFYEGSALTRTLVADLADDATLLAVEPMVFGRLSMGEEVRSVSLTDRWTVRRSGHPVHAEAFRLGPAWPQSPAALDGARAAATMLLAGPGAEALLEPVRLLIGSSGGASAWNGKLVARVLAGDAYALRKLLIPALSLCAGPAGLPRCWAV